MKYETEGHWRTPSPVLTPELPTEPALLDSSDLLQEFRNLVKASESSFQTLQTVETAFQYLRERNAGYVAEFNILSDIDTMLQNSRNGFSCMSQQNGESNLEEMLLQKQLDENEYWSHFGAKPSRDTINALHRVGEQLQLLRQLESEMEPLARPPSSVSLGADKEERVTYSVLFSFGDSDQRQIPNNDRNVTERLPPINGKPETPKQARMTRRECWSEEKKSENVNKSRNLENSNGNTKTSKSDGDNNYQTLTSHSWSPDNRNSAVCRPPSSAPGDLFSHGARIPHPPASPKPTSDTFLRRRRHSFTSFNKWTGAEEYDNSDKDDNLANKSNGRKQN